MREKSFIVTYKPESENAQKGWPIEELRKLIERLSSESEVIEKWRFRCRNKAKIGDRVFVLLQGKLGPSIIGFGTVASIESETESGGMIPIRIAKLVDPMAEPLIPAEALEEIEKNSKLWKVQFSGIEIPDDIAFELERRINEINNSTNNNRYKSNPKWRRDELILALDVYLSFRPNLPSKSDPIILKLAENLGKLGDRLHSGSEKAASYRNAAGVCMKLMNLLRLDPEYQSRGKKGLSRGAKADEDVWNEFAHDPQRCKTAAEAILASLDSTEKFDDLNEDDDFFEAPEGKILTREHKSRERNRQIVERKKRQAERLGKGLKCEVCDFDFHVQYGNHGRGFIECHHLIPVSALGQHERTSLSDLALICANCHRMIHRSKPWLTLQELKQKLITNSENYKSGRLT